jgi:hypothetical protein
MKNTLKMNSFLNIVPFLLQLLDMLICLCSVHVDLLVFCSCWFALFLLQYPLVIQQVPMMSYVKSPFNEFLYIICQKKKAIASAWLGSTTGYTIKIQCPFTPWVSNIRKIHSMLMLWCWYSKHIIMKDPHSVTYFFTESPSFVVKRGDWGALGRT